MVLIRVTGWRQIGAMSLSYNQRLTQQAT